MKDLAEAIIKLRDAATFINQLAYELDTGKTGDDREAEIQRRPLRRNVRAAAGVDNGT